MSDRRAEASPETIARLIAASPNITPGLIDRIQRAAAQCHYALNDGGVTDEHGRAWLRTIAHGLLGDNEWEDFDDWFDEWAERYAASRQSDE